MIHMDHNKIMTELQRNCAVFGQLLENVDEPEIKWSQEPEKWCLLEIVCHLHDEEIEDFRTRVKCVLEDPEKPPPSFDPLTWVEERNYKGQNYNEVLRKFLTERENSVKWLRSLKDPNWKNTYQHPKLGPMSAELFLTNWLAHDFLHIRQIIRLKYDYLKSMTGINLGYAGNW
jgi:hypothetical protein